MPSNQDWNWTSAELAHKLMELEIRELRAAWATRNADEGPKHMGRADTFREVRSIVMKGP